MSMVTGDQDRQCHNHKRCNQAASPPSIFTQCRDLEDLDASFKPPQCVVILTRGVG
jgi:hypothetical protein